MAEQGISKEHQKIKSPQKYIRQKWTVSNIFGRYGLLIVALVLFGSFSVMVPEFMTVTNIFIILRQASILGLFALGLGVIIIIGEFDISFEAIAVFCGVIPVILIMRGVDNLFVVWTIGITFGVGLSLVNAVSVIYGGIPSFIATLGMMTVLSAISLGLTGGRDTYPAVFPSGFSILGRYMIGGLIPFPVVIFIVAAVLLILLLDYSPIGRYIYAIGGNPQASLHVGINVKKVKFLAFLIAGVLLGVGGITLSSMLNVCNSNMGRSFFLPGVTTCFLGATFLKEGVHNPRGTVVAAILLAILANGFSMNNVPFFARDIIQGAILLVAIGMLAIVRKKQI